MNNESSIKTIKSDSKYGNTKKFVFTEHFYIFVKNHFIHIFTVENILILSVAMH